MAENNPMEKGFQLVEDLDKLEQSLEAFARSFETRKAAWPMVKARAAQFKEKYDIDIRFGDSWEKAYGG